MRWVKNERVKSAIFVIVTTSAVLGATWGMPYLMTRSDQQAIKTILAPETEDYTAIDALKASGLYRVEKAVQEALAALEEAGLFGNHTLLPITGETALRGEFSGHFLGGTSGEVTTYYQLIFAWQADDERYFVSTLPYEKVVFVEIPQGESPYIRFKFDGEQIVDLFEKASPATLYNLNFFITEDTIAYATVYISQQDRESNLYFLMK